MSLLFSEIRFPDGTGKRKMLREGGHPDQADLWELMETEPRYATCKAAALAGAPICVRHYRYQVKGRDWLAEREHFALMEAYDALAKRHTARPFVGRGDVKLLDQYKFHLANRREVL